MEPVVFEPTMQKTTHDCAATCLAMTLGVPYPAVLAETSRKVTKEGMSRYQIKAVAKRLGTPLRFRAKPPEDDAVGILELEDADKKTGHVAMYLKGVVYDPACGLVYTDLDAFLRDRKWVISGFFWRES